MSEEASEGVPGGALARVVVVDCGEGVAAGYASRLLADLGARVIKVEPPGGDRLRALGPFPGDEPDRELGGLHLALNAGKQSVVLDFATAEGAARLRALLRGADALIESAGPGVMESRDLGPAALLHDHPALVYASHSPFGHDGPYAERATSEIVDFAMGGYMYFCGHPERQPLMVPGHQGELHAGMQLAAGVLFALWHARRTGAGQHVEVSTFESMLNAHSWLTTSWTHGGEVQSRAPYSLIPCADGYVFWYPRGDPALFALIGRPEFIDEPPWSTLLEFRERLDDVREMIGEWAATRTRDEVVRLAQEMRIPITAVQDVEDLARSRQLAERGWWHRVEHPRAGALELPGPPWRFSETAAGVRGPAPLLGADGDVELPPREDEAPVPEHADRQPLAGVRVLEVTANWAGPLAGRHLADMGADVIKIEVARKPATRAVQPAGGERWTRPYNRAGYFNLLNRNKRDLVIDLAAPEGRELFLCLVETSDVVLENNSARVFPNLRLDYATLAERNPRIVMCSMSGFGASGPEAQYVAFGSNIEASSGLVAATGYGEGELHGTGSYYADPVTGTHGTIAILAALLARERTGRGQFIDMALQESGAAFQVEAIMDYRLNGRVAGPSANRSRRIAPQGVYRSVGADCWLAIGVESDEQWRALCEAIGRPELGARYATLEARRAAHDEIDAAIEEWTATIDHNEASRLLQAAGVPTGPVLANWEIVSDPHLFARGYFVDVVHPEVGHHRWDGYPWKLSRTPGRVRYAAPLFAEHNDEVLGGLLGLDGAAIGALRERGVVADEPEVAWLPA